MAVPHYDLTKTSQIGIYTRDYIDLSLKDTENEKIVLDMLRVVFDPNYQPVFEDYLKVVNGKSFRRAFSDKIGRGRSKTLKYLLCKIHEKYSDFNYDF